MKIHRIGNVFLNSRSLPLPRLASRTSLTTSLISRGLSSGSRRGFASRASPQKSSPAASKPPSDPVSSESSSSSSDDAVGNMLDSLLLKRPKSANIGANRSSSRPAARSVYDSGSVDSATLLDHHLSKSSTAKSSVMASMYFPSQLRDRDVLAALESQWRAEPLRPPVRLDAYVGRSETVDPARGVDLSRALQRLNAKCVYNSVKVDHIRQRFHERPGLKRKRLKSERWRKRFKEGFVAVVSKVERMRKQGW